MCLRTAPRSSSTYVRASGWRVEVAVEHERRNVSPATSAGGHAACRWIAFAKLTCATTANVVGPRRAPARASTIAAPTHSIAAQPLVEHEHREHRRRHRLGERQRGRRRGVERAQPVAVAAGRRRRWRRRRARAPSPAPTACAASPSARRRGTAAARTAPIENCHADATVACSPREIRRLVTTAYTAYPKPAVSAANRPTTLKSASATPEDDRAARRRRSTPSSPSASARRAGCRAPARAARRTAGRSRGR